MQNEAKMTAEEQQAVEQLIPGLEKMLIEVKRKLKTESKNELIRLVGALLVENYALKLNLEQLRGTATHTVEQQS